LYLPNGVSAELFKPVGQPEPATIGFLGTFSERNGSRIIIPTLKKLLRLNDVKFLLVGGGPDIPLLHREALREELEKKVIFTGIVKRDEIPKLLSKAEVLVAPYKESPELHLIFPTKVPEMMALRRPVVTAYLYEVLTTFQPGKELVVAHYDPNDYARKIATLLKEPNLARGIAEAGYRRVSEEFTWRALMEKLLKKVSEKTL
jgi:glycosyltransferase involved in cell wall biosynthesis